MTDSDIIQVCRNPGGVQLLAWLIEHSRVLEPTYCGVEHANLMWLEGQRELVLPLLNALIRTNQLDRVMAELRNERTESDRSAD